MLCPRDGDLLEHQAYFKYPRWSCASCKGVFVAERDLSENLGYKKDPKSIEALTGVKLDSVSESEIRCPKDGTQLRAVHFLTCEIDVCPGCKGLWLDWGEYEKIVRRMSERIGKKRGEPRVVEEVVVVGLDMSLDDVLDFLRGAKDWFDVFNRLI